MYTSTPWMLLPGTFGGEHFDLDHLFPPAWTLIRTLVTAVAMSMVSGVATKGTLKGKVVLMFPLMHATT